MFIEKFFMVVFFIPIAGVLLYIIFYPAESALFGKRWEFKNENLEASDEVVKYNRTVGIIALVLITIVFFILLFRGC